MARYQKVIGAFIDHFPGPLIKLSPRSTWQICVLALVAAVLLLLLPGGPCARASPVFFPEEVSDEFFTVLPWYFKFSFEAADDVAKLPAGGASASMTQKENADRDKFGEKALVDEHLAGKVVSPAAATVSNSEEENDETVSASDEKENSTQPVKMSLVRGTFTDLHPELAMELITKLNETAKSGEVLKPGEGEWCSGKSSEESG